MADERRAQRQWCRAGVLGLSAGVTIISCGLLPDAQRDSAKAVLRQVVLHSHTTRVSTKWYPQDGNEAHLEAVLELGDVSRSRVLAIPGAQPIPGAQASSAPDAISLIDPNDASATCEVYRIDPGEKPEYMSVQRGQVGLDIICGLK